MPSPYWGLLPVSCTTEFRTTSSEEKLRRCIPSAPMFLTSTPSSTVPGAAAARAAVSSAPVRTTTTRPAEGTGTVVAVGLGVGAGGVVVAEGTGGPRGRRDRE